MHKKHKDQLEKIISVVLAATVVVGFGLLPYGRQSTPTPPTLPHNSTVALSPGVTAAPDRLTTSSHNLPTQLAAVKTPTSGDTAANNFGLPSYPHPQYVYKALMSPTGPLYNTEPFLNRISAPAAWSSISGSGTGPTIAVVDTGFALNHQDLAGRWDGTQGTGSWTGWDFIDNDNNPMAGRTNPNGAAVFHGTMTAGLAGLINPDAKLMPLEALSDDGTGYTDAVAGAVRYAADNGANIISLSLGSSNDDPYLHQQIDYAISKGVLVVAAAGNGGCNCLSYPAAYPEVLSVGATDGSDNRASFSSYGSNLDLVAPGTAGDVCSSFYTPTNSTSAYSCSYSGTSFSTPIVSGAAALLLSQQPTLSPTQIIYDLTESADKVAGMQGSSFSSQYGFGRLDVMAALDQGYQPIALNGAAGKSQNISIATGSNVNLIAVCQIDLNLSSSCRIRLTGPSNQVIILPAEPLNLWGSSVVTWNAVTTGMTAGVWQVDELNSDGSVAYGNSATITVTP